MIYLLQVVIFHSYVSSPEGNSIPEKHEIALWLEQAQPKKRHRFNTNPAFAEGIEY
jgi:hypothetical protein